MIHIGGVSAAELVSEYGTPLYVLDEESLRQRCRTYTDTLAAHYPGESLAIYAGKAGLTTGIAKRVSDYGFGIDVVSGGEIHTVLEAGIDTERLYFHGNNKAMDELALAIEKNIRIIVDNETELDRIIDLSKSAKSAVRVLIRLKPEIDAHTHEYIKTGQLDSKFGVDKRDVPNLVKKIQAVATVEFLGIHAHIGSQIFDAKPFNELGVLMAEEAEKIRNATGVELKEMNIGGGLGIPYLESENAPNISEVLATMLQSITQSFQERNMPLPKLIIEPGRSTIATAGVTLYTVGTIKKIPEIRDYLFIDGGMADNPRPIMYQAEYTMAIANKANQSCDHKYAIAGRFCESGDILAKDVPLPEAELDDIIIVYGTGAYNYAMASNYNRFPRPAWVSVDNGKVSTLVRRESYADLVQNDVL